MYFKVYQPLNGHDEDAEPYADHGFMIVCDGLGATGQNTYRINGEVRTSAYLGSRVLSGICQVFYEKHYDEFVGAMTDVNRCGQLVSQLKAEISKSLTQYKDNFKLVNLVKGKSVSMLPSTLVSVLFKEQEDHVDALVISAGDSRAFVLTAENGLQQISVDDVEEGFDAFSKTSSMTNTVSEDRPFHLNYQYYSLPKKCMIFVCSDGCFDYVDHPMYLEFRTEWAICKTDFHAENAENAFSDMLGKVLVDAGLKDDCTMAGAVLGYSDLEDFRREIYPRAVHVKNTYVDPFGKINTKRFTEPLFDLERKKNEAEKALLDKWNAVLPQAIHSLFSPSAAVPVSVKPLAQEIANRSFYVSFSEELQRKNAEREKAKKELEEKLAGAEAALKEAFVDARINDKAVEPPKNSYVPIMGLPEDKKLREIQARVEETVKKARFAADRLKAELDAVPASYNLESLVIDFSQLIMYLSDLKGDKETERQLQDQKRNSPKIRKEAEAEFAKALTTNFVEWVPKFGSASRYEAVQKAYRAYADAKKKAEDCKGPTEAQLEQQFTETNRGDLASLFSECAGMVDAPLSASLAALNQQIAEISLQKEEAEKQKQAFWKEYKPGYELFWKGLGGCIKTENCGTIFYGDDSAPKDWEGKQEDGAAGKDLREMVSDDSANVQAENGNAAETDSASEPLTDTESSNEAADVAADFSETGIVSDDKKTDEKG